MKAIERLKGSEVYLRAAEILAEEEVSPVVSSYSCLAINWTATGDAGRGTPEAARYVEWFDPDHCGLDEWEASCDAETRLQYAYAHCDDPRGTRILALCLMSEIAKDSE